MYRGYVGHMGVQGAYRHAGGIWMPPIPDNPSIPASKEGKVSMFKAKFLHLKSWKIIREPSDHTRNEPTPDIPIGGSGQVVKKDKYMPFVRNMLIMKYVHHLSTEMEGKTYNMPKCIPTDAKQVNSTKLIDGRQVFGEISADINSCCQKCSYVVQLNRERTSGVPGATSWQGSLT